MTGGRLAAEAKATSALIAAAGLPLAASFVLVGCSADSGDSANGADSAASAAAASSASAPSLDVDAKLEDIVAQLEKAHDGDVGIALTTDEGTFAAGNEGGGPAWSTIKVPLAIAALRDGVPEYLVDAAIKESDNDAAYALWFQVKWSEESPSAATDAIDAVLADADSAAQWQAPDAQGDVSFGYAAWLLKDQAKFGAHLACVPESDYVYEAMTDIVDWQRYGLTDMDGVHAKGGWGFDEDSGLYTQRQFGSMEIAGGTVGVAIMVVYDDAAEVGEDEDFDKATEALDDAARRMKDLIAQGIADDALTPVKGC